MNLVFVFDGLQVGGIERVGIDYVNMLINQGYNVTVVNLCPKLCDMYPQLHKDCKLIEIHFPRWLVPYRFIKLIELFEFGTFIYPIFFLFFHIINFFRKFYFRVRLKNNNVSKTDVVIAFSGHFNDLFFVASNWLNGKKIAWLHGAEFEYKIASEGFFLLYKKIQNLVCLSELCDITCRRFNKKYSIKKELIYNPILIQEKKVDINKVEYLKTNFGKFVLMVGRLAPDKDQKTAILAVKYLNEIKNKKIKCNNLNKFYKCF